MPPVSAGDVERWLASAAVVGGLVLLFMRLTGKKPGGEYVTREEFRQFRESVSGEMDAIRDRIDSRHLGTLRAIEQTQEKLSAQLAALEAAVARVDERTRK